MDQEQLRNLLQHLTAQVQATDPGRVWESVDLALMDDEGISNVNGDFLDRHRPTDVISFVYEPQPGISAGFMGEVLVNVEQAAREGQRAGASPDSELALYITHGCLHLTGATDDTRAERARMRRTERNWLKTARKQQAVYGLYKESQARPRP